MRPKPVDSLRRVFAQLNTRKGASGILGPLVDWLACKHLHDAVRVLLLRRLVAHVFGKSERSCKVRAFVARFDIGSDLALSPAPPPKKRSDHRCAAKTWESFGVGNLFFSQV